MVFNLGQTLPSDHALHGHEYRRTDHSLSVRRNAPLQPVFLRRAVPGQKDEDRHKLTHVLLALSIRQAISLPLRPTE